MSKLAEAIRRALEEDNPNALMADGFDDALIGVGRRCGQPTLAVYSIPKCLAVLRKQGMTRDEAMEHFEFNVVGAYVGEHTPMFVDTDFIV